MRIDLLVVSLIILILGLAISGMIGSIIMAGGIIFLLYVIFSKEDQEAETVQYVEPDYPSKTTHQIERNTGRYEEPKPREESKPRYKNVERAERELRAWGSGNKSKRCPECGSTSNPPDAKFCADCGSRL